MRRAILLIWTFSLLTLGCGRWLDLRQTETALAYQRGMETVRSAVLEGRMEEARSAQADLQARWQRDEPWLNCVISHHHTRAVNTAMRKLTTALEMNWQLETLQALDEALDALDDIARSDAALWENIL